ncbi:Hok/Gef family protein [Escherichia coli]|nr:Hok/Gef family protein [Escherichia coli]
MNKTKGCLIANFATVPTFTLLTRQTLYELRFRDGDKEVAALMACTSR